MKHDATPVAVHDVLPGPFKDNPWMGLAFYTEQNQSLFFGRQKESADLLRLLQRDTLTVLFGRSGMGKTSLLRAGLIPRLRQDTFFPVILRIDYADNAPPPVEQVKALTIEAARIVGIDVENLSACGPDATLWEFFHTVEFWGMRNDILTPVLIFDQFEELFTLCRTCPGTEEFTTQLADLVENRVPCLVIDRISESGERFAMDSAAPKYKVVLSLREDYVFRLDGLLPIMPAVMRNRLALHPLESERALEVILGAGGNWVAEDVASCIVAAVAGKKQEAQEPTAAAVQIEPAYLSVMCHELFRRMQILGIPSITQKLVASEQSNILDGLYERSFEGLAARTRLFVEDHLLTPSGFRATLPIEDAGREGVSAEELGSLVDRRLLRFEDRLGTRHVELSHDILTPVVQRRRDERREALARKAERKRQAEMHAKLRRSRMQAAIAFAVALLITAGFSLYYFGNIHHYVVYSRNFSKQWGMPQPVGELTKSDQEHLAWSLKFTKRGWFGPVLSFEAVDSLGKLTTYHEVGTYFSDSTGQSKNHGECRWEFVYNQNDQVIKEVARNRFQRMVWGLVYAPPKDGDKQVKTASVTFIGPDGYPQPMGGSRAEFVEIEYDDEKGYEHLLRYQDIEGNSMPGPDDAYGILLDYDALGRLIRKTSLDAQGLPMNDALGNAGQEAVYDEKGNPIEYRNFDKDGEPTLADGFWKQKNYYDSWGRIIQIRFYNLRTERCGSKWGAHMIKWTYDERGNVMSMALFDNNHNPIAPPTELFEFPAHRVEYEYDELNRVKSRRYLKDESNTPTSGPEEWHRVRIDYDDKGFPDEFSYYDTNDSPVMTPSLAHRVEYRVDSYGQPVEERFFDVNGDPASNESGYHLRRNKYDRRGNITEQAYFDTNEQPCADRTDGSHLYRKRYDRFGKPSLIELFDTSEEPMNGKDGWHREQARFNDYGDKVMTRWFDKNETPCPGPDGVHAIRYEYDERGLRTRIAAFHGYKQPAETKGGIHETLMEYNDKRQQTLWQFFGLDKKLAEDSNGDHLRNIGYDDRGREISRTHLRADGSANLNRELGIATHRRKYDVENRWTEDSYLDVSERLTIGPYGYAKGLMVFAEGDRSETTCIGPDGKPMFNALEGCVSRRDDPRTRGTVINTSYHGLDRILMFGPEGYAVQESTYDDKNRYIMRRWLGPDKEPVPGPQGYHRIDVQYTKSGTTETMFDVSGKEISSEELALFPELITVTELLGPTSPAAKAGMQKGDSLWRYGDWLFPEAVATEQKKGTAEKNLLMEVFQAMTSERDKRSGEEVSVWVIRHGEPVRLTMPPLPKKLFGAGIQDRTVPPEVYETWRKAAEQALLRNQ